MGNGGGGTDKESKRYDDDEGGMDQGRGKEIRKKDKNFFNLKKKRYEDQLGSKLEQQPFPVTAPESLLGILTMRNKSASTRIPL